MTMLFLEFVSVTFEYFCFTIFCLLSFRENIIFNARTVLLIGLSVATIFLCSSANALTDLTYLQIILYTFGLVLISRCLFNLKTLYSFLYSLIFLFVLSLFDLAISVLFEYVFKTTGYIAQTTYRVGFGYLTHFVIAKIFILMFSFLFWKLSVDFDKVTGLITIVLSCRGTACVQILKVSFVSGYNINAQKAVLIATIFFMFFVISFFVILKSKQKITKNMIENEILKSQVVLSEQKNQNTLESYKEISKLSHDYNNHLQVLSMLVENSDSSDAAQYIKKLLETKNDAITQFTGNTAIDAVLSAKKEAATQKGIEFLCDFSCPIYNTIETTDICTILLNILDNSIEACERIDDCEKKTINVVGETVNKMFFIRVENTTF